MLQNAARQLTPVLPSTGRQAALPRISEDFADWLGEVTLSPRASALELPTIAEFSASLPQDAVTFVLLPGNKRSIGLWITQYSTEVVRLGQCGATRFMLVR